MALEDIIKQISDESERTQFQAILDKYPATKTVIEVGDRVGPILESLKPIAAGNDPMGELTKLPEWVKFRNDHWLNDRHMWDATAVAVDRAAELQARVTELESKGESEMTLEEIEGALKAKGVVFKDDLKGNIDETKLLGSMNLQAKRFEEIYAKLTPLVTSHVEKFKEPLPVADVLKYIEEKGERDPLKAYEAVIQPKLHQLEIAELKAEAAKARTEGEAEGVKKAQALLGQQRQVVDGGGGVRAGGSHFLAKIFKRREERAAGGGNGRLGSGDAARAGYADFQKKQMGAGAV